MLHGSAGGLGIVVVVVADEVGRDHKNQGEEKESQGREESGCESGADAFCHWGLSGCQTKRGCGGGCLRVW